MNIKLHIERLILDGVPLDRRQALQLQAAVEASLARLLGDGGLGAALTSGATLASIQGSAIQGANCTDPAALGTQIGAAVYGGLGGRHE